MRCFRAAFLLRCNVIQQRFSTTLIDAAREGEHQQVSSANNCRNHFHLHFVPVQVRDILAVSSDDVNVVDEDGNTPLIHAASLGAAAHIKHLLGQGRSMEEALSEGSRAQVSIGATNPVLRAQTRTIMLTPHTFILGFLPSVSS